MQVFIVRHGKADALPGEYPDDSLRPLTEAGKEEMYQFALIWKKMGIVFDKLVSSPLVRARQTAEMIAKAYGWKNKIAEEDALGYDYSVGNVLSMLNKFHGKKEIALVGHNPDLCELASALLSGSNAAGVDFKKSAIMGINFMGAPYPGSGYLKFYLPPKILRPLIEEQK